VGTIRYMAPEVFSGQADCRSDVYSLGVTLYELLAMRPAFAESNRRQLVRQVLEDSPPRLRTLDRQIPRDLETIVHKAMERDARLRYPSAAELAADLNRFLRDEPIRARRTSALAYVRRWCWRNKAVSGLMGALALVLVIGVSLVLWSWRDAVLANARAGKAIGELIIQRQAAVQAAVAADNNAGKAQRAQEQTAKVNRQLEDELRRTALAKYALTITLAFHRASDGDLLGAEELLEDCPRELVGWEYGYVKALCRPQVESWQAHAGNITATAFSADGRWLATAGRDDALRIWDISARKEIALLEAKSPVTKLEFSRDGRQIVSHGGDNLVTLWDVEAHEARWSAPVPATACTALHFHPDGSEVLASGLQGWWKRWNAESGEELPGDGPPGFEAVISPDGKYVAIAQRVLGPVVLWDVARRQIVWAHQPTANAAYVAGTLIFDPSGEWLLLKVTASGGIPERHYLSLTSWQTGLGRDRPMYSAYSADGRRGIEIEGGELSYFDAQTDRRYFRLTTAGRRGFSISPDGSLVAAGTREGAVQLIRTVPQLTHSPPELQRSSASALTADAYTSDESANEYAIVIYEVGSKEAKQRLTGIAQRPEKLLFSPDFKLLVAQHQGNEPSIDVWDVATGRKLHELKGHRAALATMAFHPGGQLVSADRAGVLCLWDVVQGRLAHRLVGHEGPVRDLSFSPDGKQLISFNCPDRTARLWSLQTGALVHCFLHAKPVTEARVCPVGRLLATQADNGVLMWDLRSGDLLYTRDRPAREMVFSPDGRRIVLSQPDEFSHNVLDSATGQELLVLPYTRGRLAFSDDGRHLDRAPTVTSAGLRWEGADFVHPQGSLNRVRSPWTISGNQVLTAGSGALEGRDLQSGRTVRHALALPAPVADIAASPDGRWLAYSKTTSPRGKLVVVDRATGRQVFAVDGFQGAPLQLAFSPDSTRLAAVHRDTRQQEAVSVWEAASGRRVSYWRSKATSSIHVSRGLHVAVSRQSKTLRLVSLVTGQEVPTPLEYRGWRQKFDVGLRRLAVAADSFRESEPIQVWDLEPLAKIAEFPGFGPVAFHPSEQFLACCGPDGSIELWDCERAHKLASFRAHLTRMDNLTFNDAGSFLISGDTGRTTKVWDISPWLPPADQGLAAVAGATSLPWVHSSAPARPAAPPIRVVLPDLGQEHSLANDWREQRYDRLANRLTDFGIEVVTVPWRAFEPGLARPGDVLFLPSLWSQPQSRYDLYESRQAEFHAFVHRGGGLIVSQPNPPKECTPALLPYPITFHAEFDSSNRERINLGKEAHFITRGLKDSAMPFPHDPMIEVDTHYQVLAIQKKTQWPSLAACTWGQGRVVVQTNNEGVFANGRLNDELLRRIVVWAAGREESNAK
jgi:WD40 repeat protein